MVSVADLDEAIDVANRSRYGLDSSVFSQNLDNAWRAARELECGMVTVNDAPPMEWGHFPSAGASRIPESAARGSATRSTSARR